MSGGMRGGEIHEMNAMGDKFKRHASDLQSLINDLNSRTVSSTDIWKGPGADKFRNEWHTAKGSFTKMVHALETGSKAIKDYARNIEAATR